jgi:hypothetical protein
MFLKRRCCTESGIEGYIVGLAVGRPGLDVTTSFALGMRARAASRMLTG